MPAYSKSSLNEPSLKNGSPKSQMFAQACSSSNFNVFIFVCKKNTSLSCQKYCTETSIHIVTSIIEPNTIQMLGKCIFCHLYNSQTFSQLDAQKRPQSPKYCQDLFPVFLWLSTWLKRELQSLLLLYLLRSTHVMKPLRSTHVMKPLFSQSSSSISHY